MAHKSRDVFIKIDKAEALNEHRVQIQEQVELLKELFLKYDKLHNEENKIFENWANYVENISQHLDHISH